MSLREFYHKPVVWASAEVGSVATTTTIHTPSTGKRFILDSLTVANIGAASTTVYVYYGVDSTAVKPTRVVGLNLAQTASINLQFPGLDNELAGQPIRVNSLLSPVTVSVYGFELEN